ncbi:hypothetical protein BDV93DRAFT_547380 [Ceratobasidium sp. AG-I]|nr:hypothetical protein BDV93DRAFT_547380 [Ceratobasidium sp. AG-I]
MLPPVPCTIAHPGGSLLTMEEPNDSAPLIIVAPTGNPGEQEWRIEQNSENGVALRNLKHDKYIGVRGTPQQMAFIVPSDQPFEFKLEPAEGRHNYKLFVEGEGEKLYLDMSMLRMYPPQVSALLPSRLAGGPWSFQFSD